MTAPMIGRMIRLGVLLFCAVLLTAPTELRAQSFGDFVDSLTGGDGEEGEGGEGALGALGRGMLGEASQRLTGDRDLLGQGLDIALDTVDALDSVFGPADSHFLGRRVAAGLIGGRPVLPPDAPPSVYVSQIATALALASSAPYQYSGYTTLIVRDDEVNAFATPGGFVIITTGMLRFLRDEDELAVVLGHEIGHIEMQHGLEAIAQAKGMGVLDSVVELGTDQALSRVGGPAVARQAVSGLSGAAFDLLTDAIENGYSVEIESEADRRGMTLAAALGYDPFAMVTVLERFRGFTGSYGGAGYPEQRGADAQAFLEGEGYAQVDRASERRDRFAAIIRGEGEWSPAAGATAIAQAPDMSPDAAPDPARESNARIAAAAPPPAGAAGQASQPERLVRPATRSIHAETMRRIAEANRILSAIAELRRQPLRFEASFSPADAPAMRPIARGGAFNARGRSVSGPVQGQVKVFGDDVYGVLRNARGGRVDFIGQRVDGGRVQGFDGRGNPMTLTVF